MAEGLPKPKSVADTLRDRGRDIDAQVDAIVMAKEPMPKPEVPKEPTKGLPKPSMMGRLKKLVGLD